MYRVVFTQRALKDLERIDQKLASKLAAKLKEYAREPLKHARKLINPKLGTYRFRIGDYRVVFDIESEEVVVLRVGHRRDIYRG